MGVHMKKFLFISLLLVLSIFVFPQDKNYKTTALSFSFNGFNLSSYYGGVGGRYWVSESTVLNASVGGLISEREYEETENLDNSLEKSKYLSIGIGMENHIMDVDNLSPYFSSRISFGISDQYYRSVYGRSEQIDKTYSYNLDLGFGVEYWLIDRISLSGQHLFNIRYETGQRTVNNSNPETQDVKGFGVGFGTTSIMLSIYF